MIESSNLFEKKISETIFGDVEIDVISNHLLLNYKNISKLEYSNHLKMQIHSPSPLVRYYPKNIIIECRKFY
jgi:hypothetical protein